MLARAGHQACRCRLGESRVPAMQQDMPCAHISGKYCFLHAQDAKLAGVTLVSALVGPGTGHLTLGTAMASTEAAGVMGKANHPRGYGML